MYRENEDNEKQENDDLRNTNTTNDSLYSSIDNKDSGNSNPKDSTKDTLNRNEYILFLCPYDNTPSTLYSTH